MKFLDTIIIGKAGKDRDTVSVEPVRAVVWVSCAHKTLFAYNKDTSCVSKEIRYSIGVGIADTDFLYRDQP